jgi:superfamily I DNA and/or RNA helicase
MYMFLFFMLHIGTGKSKVIANLVTQILYGDGRYVGGRPLRILVCAPSNAAIDEIVLRLLDIRGAIKGSINSNFIITQY